MLNDDVIERVNERLVRRIEQANEYIIEIVGKNLRKINSLKKSDINKLSNILKYGGDYEKIVNKLAKITKMNKKDIYKIFNEVAKHDYNFAKQFYDYRKMKFIPYEQNTELKTLVNSIARMTANEYVNISQITKKTLGLGIVDKEKNIVFKGLKEAYTQIIDEAILNISTGRETIDDALKRSLKEFDRGLRVVYDKTYIGKDGKEHHYTKRLDSALRQQMNDGLRTLHNELQQEIGQQFDSDGVEITVHGYPAIDHEEVQGRQFSNEQYKKLQESGIATDYKGKNINLHVLQKSGSRARSFRPISQYNCYHYTFAIILGVNEPQYTDEQLQKFIDDNNEGFMYNGRHYTMYEGTQLQRQLETAIRDNKNNQIMARASNDEEMILETQTNITKLNKKYKKLCEASGLPSKANRMKVSGYKRIKINDKIINKLDESKFIDYNKDAMKMYEDFYIPYKDKVAKLTDKQKNAIKTYTKDGFSDIQGYILHKQGLYDDFSSFYSNKDIDRYIETLDEVLDNNEIGKDVVLYRGTYSKFYKDYKLGDIVDTYNLFTSSSLNKAVGGKFCQNRFNQGSEPTLMKILAPKDTKGFYIDELGLDEEELLLSRKTKYRFIRREKIKDSSYFNGEKELEQIVVEIIK